MTIKRVFIQNPESGEPWAYCGSLTEGWEKLATAIGHFVQAEVEGAAENGQSETTVAFRLVDMTDEEVAALPDI